MKKINLVLISVLFLSALFFACKTEADAPKTYYTVTIDQGFGSGLTNTSYQVEKGTPLKSSQLEGKPTIPNMIPTYKAGDTVYTLDQTEVNGDLALKIEWADDPSITCTDYDVSKFADYVQAYNSLGIACAITKGAKIDEALYDPKNTTAVAETKNALHYVSSAGKIDLVKYLVAHGADVEAYDMDIPSPNGVGFLNKGTKRTALLWAANGGSLDVVQYLLAHGSKIEEQNLYNGTALTEAANGGYYALVKYLLENTGVKINDKDKDNNTALMYAVSTSTEVNSGDRLATVKYLASYNGVDLSIRNNYDNKTALGIAKSKATANPDNTIYADIVSYLKSISAPE